MFKNVDYAGFDEHPELRDLAERAVTKLAEVVREWDYQIELALEAYPDRPAGVEVTVNLKLPPARGTASRFLTRDELLDPDVLDSRCRSIWMRAMDSYIERRKPMWEELVNQPAEV